MIGNNPRKNSLKLSLLFTLPYLIPAFGLIGKPADEIPNLYFQQILDGLSQSNVRCIIEDQRGYIWLGNRRGLNRFDGKDVKIFEADESLPNSIPDNRINDLFLDSKNNLWIATYNSLARYVEEKDHFIMYNKDPLEGEEKYLDALSLFEDALGQLWIGTNHGIFVLDVKHQKLIRHVSPGLQKLESKEVYSIENYGENICFGTNKGLFVWNPRADKLKNVLSPNGENVLGKVNDLCEDRKGRLWVASLDMGLFRIGKRKDGKWAFKSYYAQEKSHLGDSKIFTVFEDSKERIWVGTESLGLNLYLEEKDSFFAYKKDPTDKMALQSNSVWTIFEDRAGRMFLGSNNQGMFMYDPYGINFNHKNHLLGQRLKFSTVSSFLEVGKDIWIATDGGGITLWDREAKSYSFLNHQAFEKNSLGSDEVLSLFKDSRGIIWAGNWDGGLNRYNPKTQDFKNYSNNPSPTSLGSNNVFSIKEDASGNLWMTTWGQGVSRYNRSTDDFFNIGYIPYNDDHMAHNMTYDLEIDNTSGDIWVATVIGLDRISMLPEDKYKIKHFRHEEDKPNSLSTHNVNCILEDHKNRLWVGTADGLNLFDRKSESFTRFYKKDGLPDNAIQEMVQDDNHDFWISTSNGLAKMTETATGFAFETYNKSDGLQANEFFINAGYKTSSGEIFLGGINGFNHFNPHELRSNPFAPKVQFTGFKLFNKELKIGSNSSPLLSHINSLKKLRLKSSQSVFSFEFHAVDMSNPEKHQFAFKLSGFDQAWNYVGKQRNASYTNLDPGNYTFMLKAANRDGVWNNVARKIDIEVLPEWWQTWWAKSLFILIPLAFLSAVLLSRISFIKSQKRKLDIQVAEQTQELREQKKQIEKQAEQLQLANHQKNKLFSIISHDLRSPVSSLQGIINLLDPAILKEEDLLKIRTNLSNKIEGLGKVLVNLLEWSKSQMEGEFSENIAFDLRVLSTEICEMYQMTADQKGVSLLNAFSKPLMVQGDPNQIRIVLRNLIGNALKFTRAKDVVCISHKLNTSEEVIIQVSDTGVGMDEDQRTKLFQLENCISTTGTSGEKGVGLGLLLVKEYIEKNSGNISVESAPGEGTSFTISLKRA